MDEPPLRPEDDEGPRRPEDDDWESRLPDEYAPIPDPRPKTLLKVTAIVVVAALVVTAAPVVFRLIFDRDGGGQPAPAGQSVIEGVVLAGPQCPVLISGSPCPDEPVATEITVTDRSVGEVIGVARSGRDGRFRILLPPGDYTLQAGSTSRPFPHGVPTDVSVEPGRIARLELRVDTGIR